MWRSVVQIGKETTPGTNVAATRKIYTMEPILVPNREVRYHNFAVGARTPTRQVTAGVEAPSGRISMPMSSAECIELFLAGLKGGVTPTTPAGTVRLWTFVPDATALDSWTTEWDDGALVWELSGTHVDRLTIAGNVRAENRVSAELLGRGLISSSLTGALTDRVPEFIEGWQTDLFIDAYGGTAGTTQVEGTLINWEVVIANNIQRKYFASNTKVVGGLPVGELAITANLLFEGVNGLAHYNDMVAGTKKLIRLQFQDETGFIESTYRRFVTVDLPGAWSAIDLGQSEAGTRVYRLSYTYVHDVTNAYPVQVRAQNNRATAYA